MTPSTTETSLGIDLPPAFLFTSPPAADATTTPSKGASAAPASSQSPTTTSFPSLPISSSMIPSPAVLVSNSLPSATGPGVNVLTRVTDPTQHQLAIDGRFGGGKNNTQTIGIGGLCNQRVCISTRHLLWIVGKNSPTSVWCPQRGTETSEEAFEV